MHNPNPIFVLKTSDPQFLQRQNDVFAQLNTSLQSSSPNDSMDIEDNSSTQPNNRSLTRQFRGKESIFKRPQDPIRKHYMRTIPDFKKNPHKWTKYSLADVKDDDMSDKSNTKAALSFLNELKSRTNNDEGIDEEVGSKKIVFKKVLRKASPGNVDSQSTFRSSKVVMPEYVVGQKVEKDKKTPKAARNKGAELKLDHLFEDE